jgi:adenylate cyclase
VNLASRLEGANKYYGSRILLSEFTARELTRPSLLREIDLIRVKGKDRPVAVYESLGYRQADLADGLRPMLDAFEDGLAAYRGCNWKAAIKAFQAALKAEPGDGPSAMYLERCRLYAASPPPEDWDGVWVLTEK